MSEEFQAFLIMLEKDHSLYVAVLEHYLAEIETG